MTNTDHTPGLLDPAALFLDYLDVVHTRCHAWVDDLAATDPNDLADAALMGLAYLTGTRTGLNGGRLNRDDGVTSLTAMAVHFLGASTCALVNVLADPNYDLFDAGLPAPEFDEFVAGVLALASVARLAGAAIDPIAVLLHA